MPVGSAPPASSPTDLDKSLIRLVGVLTADPIDVGMAVAIRESGGLTEIVRCGVTTYGDQFFGISNQTVGVGVELTVVVGRGSKVTPVVVGGGLLTPNTRVFLSPTAGEVTQALTAPGAGVVNMPIGFAVSTTEMVLTTDAKFFTPG